MKSFASLSITRRLVITVLILELLSAVALIAAITVHEWSVQLEIFDGSLVASAESLMGAVQDTEDEGDNVMLDMRGVRVARHAVFRVEDERGGVLGFAGDPPHLALCVGSAKICLGNCHRMSEPITVSFSGPRLTPGMNGSSARHSFRAGRRRPARPLFRSNTRFRLRFMFRKAQAWLTWRSVFSIFCLRTCIRSFATL